MVAMAEEAAEAVREAAAMVEVEMVEVREAWGVAELVVLGDLVPCILAGAARNPCADLASF